MVRYDRGGDGGDERVAGGPADAVWAGRVPAADDGAPADAEGEGEYVCVEDY